LVCALSAGLNLSCPLPAESHGIGPSAAADCPEAQAAPSLFFTSHWPFVKPVSELAKRSRYG